MPALVFLGAVVLPIVVWIWFIRHVDTSEPEPRTLVRRCFLIAILSGIAAGFVELLLFPILGLPHDILSMGAASVSFGLMTLAVVLVGVIEELAKYLVLRANAYFSHDFNQIFDGVVYGITIALGFSFMENILYFFKFFASESTPVFIVSAIFRGLFSTLGHVTFTGVLGYFVGKAKFSNGNRWFIIGQGLVYASLLHASFNFLVTLSPQGSFLAFGLIAACFGFFIRLWNKPEVRMVWKYTP